MNLMSARTPAGLAYALVCVLAFLPGCASPTRQSQQSNSTASNTQKTEGTVPSTTKPTPPSGDRSREFLERFLVTSDPKVAFAASRTAFKGYPEAVKLDMEGPAILRKASGDARDAELKATYTTLANDIEKYGHCMKGGKVPETADSWWRTSTPLDPRDKYCQDATVLSHDGSLRLFLYFLLREQLGRSDADLTQIDKRFRDLLTTGQALWDQSSSMP